MKTVSKDEQLWVQLLERIDETLGLEGQFLPDEMLCDILDGDAILWSMDLPNGGKDCQLIEIPK